MSWGRVALGSRNGTRRRSPLTLKPSTCIDRRHWVQRARSNERRPSIVAVHGMNAHPYWTWAGKPKRSKKRHSKAKGARSSIEPVIWLERLLPPYVPDCRIMSFGYESAFLRSAPKRDVANCAQELLLALDGARSQEHVSLSQVTVCSCSLVDRNKTVP